MLTCDPAHAQGERIGGSTCNTGISRRSSASPRFAPRRRHRPHNTTNMINAWWHSNICARAFACHARDDCGVVSSVSIVKTIFFFPFSFFPKRVGKTRSEVPSLPGGGWGGDGRVHASGANLDPYPAGVYYFYFYYFYLVLCFYFSIYYRWPSLPPFPLFCQPR